MNTNSSPYIIYFDGVCGLCNFFVDFVIKNDKKNKFLFTPLQGQTAQENIPTSLQNLTTVIVQMNGTYYSKSTAALHILIQLGGVWKIAVLAFLFPAFLRNWVYDFIAKNRYKWFGQKETCRIPTSDERKKFLP